MSRFVRILLVLLVMGLAGCASTLRGAPEQPFSKAVVNGTAGIVNIQDNDISSLVRSSSVAERERLVNQMLAAIDLRYSDFRNKLAASSRHAGSFFDLGVLTMDIAGGLATSAAAKTNYIAASSLLSGTEGSLNQNYLHSQTLSALIAQMDASRKQKLLAIQLALRSQSVGEYPGTAALSDVIDYYQAGTLISAVIAIQKQAANTEQKAADELRSIGEKTQGEIDTERTGSDRMDTLLASLDAAMLTTLSAHLAAQGYPPKSRSATDIRNALRDYRSDNFEGDYDALEAELRKALGLGTAN